MSRIIKSIINSVLESNNNYYFIFHGNSKKDIDIIKNIKEKVFSFEKNESDLNNLIELITDQELMRNLSLIPKYVLNTCIYKYESAKNLSNILRVPLINIIDNLDNTKKEGLFQLAQYLDKDINIFFNIDIPKKLFLTNYIIISDIEEIQPLIKKELRNWKPI